MTIDPPSILTTSGIPFGIYQLWVYGYPFYQQHSTTTTGRNLFNWPMMIFRHHRYSSLPPKILIRWCTPPTFWPSPIMVHQLSTNDANKLCSVHWVQHQPWICWQIFHQPLIYLHPLPLLMKQPKKTLSHWWVPLNNKIVHSNLQRIQGLNHYHCLPIFVQS